MILFHDDPAVLSRRDHDRRHVRSLRLHPVGTAVDPAGIGILHDHEAGGADERSAIVFVPDGGRDFREIDGPAFENIVHERAAVDLARR